VTGAVLEFLPDALSDAEAATRYYEECLSGLGVRFQAEIESLCAAILRQPLLWNERSGGHRRVNLPGFGFRARITRRNVNRTSVEVRSACRRCHWGSCLGRQHGKLAGSEKTSVSQEYFHRRENLSSNLLKKELVLHQLRR